MCGNPIDVSVEKITGFFAIFACEILMPQVRKKSHFQV
jgi:hypothetical protein